MSKDQLRFPSGRTVRKVKQDAKKIKQNYSSNTEALNALAIEHGVNMPWDKALSYLEDFWNSWFSVHIFQEEAHWQIDVRHKRFQQKDEAENFASSFYGSLKWVGGDNPLVLINDKTGEKLVLNNADVRLWRTKAEAMNKICISQDDRERVYAPILKWPELFENENPTFGSLASGVEYGDDNGSPKSSIEQDNPQGASELDKIGIKVRAEQAKGKIIQIKHPYERAKSNYYLITKFSVAEIESIIATLFDLTEFNGFLPSYYSGGIALWAKFISKVLEQCFEQVVITSDNFDYTSSEDDDIDVSVVNIFHIEDGFNPSQYDLSTFSQFIKEKHNTILSAFRQSEGMPVTFNEQKWKLVNINPIAIERKQLPLSVNDLKVNEAWRKRYELEEVILHAIGADEGLSRHDDRFGIYDLYYEKNEHDEISHDYPVYRVQHDEFEFDAG